MFFWEKKQVSRGKFLQDHGKWCLFPCLIILTPWFSLSFLRWFFSSSRHSRLPSALPNLARAATSLAPPKGHEFALALPPCVVSKSRVTQESHRNPMPFLLFCVSWKSKIRYPKTSYIWDIPCLWLDPRDWLPTSIHRLYTCCALFLNEVKSKGVLLVSCPQSFQEWYTDKLKAGCFAKLQQVEWTLSSGM